MSSSIGKILKITLFGESHNVGIGMVIDGLPAGTIIDENAINIALKNRKVNNALSTTRNEDDSVIFLSGVFNGKTTGSPLAFSIYNSDIDSSKYEEGVIRPSHSDLTEYLKYNGYNDYRGGGFTSGRITASIIVLGVICKQILSKYEVDICTHVKSLKGIVDDSFTDIKDDARTIRNAEYPVINETIRKEMISAIDEARKNGDSIGGELETIITNSPVGLGEPYFDSFESYLSQCIFSIGGVKGINFGDTELFKKEYGSITNDQLRINDGKIEYLSNHSGGVNGGITNGQPILFTTVVKPTPSIAKKQQSINVKTNENIDLEIKGRHDPCILHRVAPVIDAFSAFVIVDLLMAKESKNI